MIEPKHNDGTKPCDYPDDGQLGLLRDDVRLGKAVIVLYGCGVCDSPQAIRILHEHKKGACASRDGCAACDEWHDWRGLDIEQRRKHLKEQIDRALGLKEAA